MRQLELALAERERQRQESAIAAVEKALVEELAAAVHPELLEHRARFAIATHRTICDKRENLRAQVEVCQQARALLLKTRVETKKFETHKEAHQAEARRQEQRLEQATADEVAGQQFLRRQEVAASED